MTTNNGPPGPSDDGRRRIINLCEKISRDLSNATMLLGTIVGWISTMEDRGPSLPPSVMGHLSDMVKRQAAELTAAKDAIGVLWEKLGEANEMIEVFDDKVGLNADDMKRHPIILQCVAQSPNTSGTPDTAEDIKG